MMGMNDHPTTRMDECLARACLRVDIGPVSLRNPAVVQGLHGRLLVKILLNNYKSFISLRRGDLPVPRIRGLAHLRGAGR